MLETERTLRDLEKRLAIWKERPEHSRAEQDQAAREIRELKSRLSVLRARQKEEQGIGDGLYWPLFNLDIKNPHSLEALEHRSPEALILEILEKERRVMEIIMATKDQTNEQLARQHQSDLRRYSAGTRRTDPLHPRPRLQRRALIDRR
ncbi:hypothetical protein [Thiorhodococcus mannitoliphagus]|uniref:hypothetical protein n=1 Tax=Thiorhodococcus mannitoliphagus TaxID=329406 RepID=UPI001F0D9CBA|nr:hypothetical protein [Thiorhodococcus mannitoliphagus]